MPETPRGDSALNSGEAIHHPAFAADDVMAGFYGNTAVSTGGSIEIHTHYRADHTFDFVGSMMFISKTFKGTWALDGKGNICRTYIGDPPPDTTNPSCAPIVARKVDLSRNPSTPRSSRRGSAAAAVSVCSVVNTK